MKILQPESTHRTARRNLSQLVTADLKQVNLYEASRGAKLGNHYHKSTTEYFYIIKGTFMVEVGSASFAANPGLLFKVEPYENHVLEALTNKASFLTFLSEPYNDKQPDLHK